jgi:FkbM family methyltransferase
MRIANIRGHVICLSALPTEPVVFDLGANHGEFSKTLRQRTRGDFVLFEPNPALTADLKREGFAIQGCAVSDHDGELPFHIAAFDEGSSLHALPAESPMNCVKIDEVTVPTRSLQSILEESPRCVDLLKIDIEGAETEALLGVSSQQLSRVGQITVEFHCAALFGGLTDADGVEKAVQHVAEAGFFVFDFSPRRPRYPRTDVLFVNRRTLSPTQSALLRGAAWIRPRAQQLWRWGRSR